MTIADITAASAGNAERFEPRFRGCAREAFKDGACWAYQHLLQAGDNPAWCIQPDLVEWTEITPDLLLKNGWRKNSEDGTLYSLTVESNGNAVYLDYFADSQQLFYGGSIIPYPVHSMGQIRAVYEFLRINKEILI